LLILLCSCNTSVEKSNDYLNQFNDEVFAIINQPEKIKVLKKRELEKYKKTGDRLYLISSEYCGLFTHHDKYSGYVKKIAALYFIFFLVFLLKEKKYLFSMNRFIDSILL